MKRVLVVTNKWWECDPALGAMLNDNCRPRNSPWPQVLQPPRQQPDPYHLPPENPHPQPRAIFPYETFAAEIWCVSDLIEDLPPECQSSTSAKASRMERPFKSGDPADLVIAVGTAWSCSEAPDLNGGVAIGTAVFMHDAHPESHPNALSQWRGQFDTIIDSAIDPAFLADLAAFDSSSAVQRFLPVALNPALSPAVSFGRGDVALGTMNVTDYSEYQTQDPRTVNAFRSLRSGRQAVSLETTHGLIRAKCGGNTPFLFVSGITDRLGMFSTDVTPRSYAQNTAAAHNAGVAVIWLLAQLDSIWGAEPPKPNEPRPPVTSCPGCQAQ